MSKATLVGIPRLRELLEDNSFRIPGGCWIWTGNVDTNGYGRVCANGSTALAHRVSWLVFRGEIPSRTPCVLHDCPGGDWPSCVNPAHLWLGTKRHNNLDRAIKNRSRSGALPRGVGIQSSGRFYARSAEGGREIYLGTFDTVGQAASAASARREELQLERRKELANI